MRGSWVTCWPQTTNITPLLWVQFPDAHHQVLGTHMATRVQWSLYFSMYKCPVQYNYLKLWNLHLLSHLGIYKFSQTYLSNTNIYLLHHLDTYKLLVHLINLILVYLDSSACLSQTWKSYFQSHIGLFKCTVQLIYLVLVNLNLLSHMGKYNVQLARKRFHW